MSLSVSGVSANQPIIEPAPVAKPVPAPTSSEQINDLASSGATASQIATQLAVPVAQVDQQLGITTSTTVTSASAVAALAGHLDVQA